MLGEDGGFWLLGAMVGFSKPLLGYPRVSAAVWGGHKGFPELGKLPQVGFLGWVRDGVGGWAQGGSEAVGGGGEGQLRVLLGVGTLGEVTPLSHGRVHQPREHHSQGHRGKQGSFQLRGETPSLPLLSAPALSGHC